MNSSGYRLHDLDGIRGWASVAVVLFHLIWEVFGSAQPSLRNFITSFLIDGKIGVYIFFILSGEILSIFFYDNNYDATVKIAIKRYSRLLIPIFSSCAIIFILKNLGTVYNVEAASVVSRQEWLGSWLLFPVTIIKLLKYSFFDCFIFANPATALNPFLWTMRSELFGSYFVFLMLLIDYFLIYKLRSAYWRPVFVFTVAVAIKVLSEILDSEVLTPFAYFAAGMLLAQLRNANALATIRRYLPNAACIAFLACICLLDGYFHFFKKYEDREAFALPILLLFQISPWMTGFFSNGVSRFLGSLSFPLYLMQFPIIISLTSWSIIYVGPDLLRANIWYATTIIAVSFAACLISAYLFSSIERFTRRVGDWLVVLIYRAFPLLRVRAVSSQHAL